MNLAVISSINDVPIRLTEERWDHINEERNLQSYLDDVIEAVQSPEFVLRGYKGTFIAVVPFGRLGFLHVVYREVNNNDGFIITAYFKRDFDKGKIVWRVDQ